jgi:hypothetical protein
MLEVRTPLSIPPPPSHHHRNHHHHDTLETVAREMGPDSMVVRGFLDVNK